MPKTERVSAAFEPELRKSFANACNDAGSSPSQMIRKFAEAFVAKQKDANKALSAFHDALGEIVLATSGLGQTRSAGQQKQTEARQ